MRKYVQYLFLTPLWLACQSNEPVPFGLDPAAMTYNDEASWSKVSFCSDARCDSPYSEEHYSYNAAGQLVRINYMSRLASGKLELASYIEQTYNSEGQLVNKVRYGKYNTGWVRYDESEYEYTAGNLKTERTYFNQRNSDQKVLTGIITYDYKEGKKINQNWYDNLNKLYQRAGYEYKNNVLTRETRYGDKENIIRIFEHTFAGNRRQIGEYVPSLDQPIALIEKTYDDKGRLLTQETKVSNPLLCAMTPGMVRYSY